MRLDHERLRGRRRELHVSERDLAAAAGVAKIALRYLEAGGGDGTVTLDLLRRIAARLAIEPADLLCEDESSIPATPDGARIGAVLVELGQPITVEAAATALGWTLQRTHAALQALSEQLPVVGQALECCNGIVSIRRSAILDGEALAAAHAAGLAHRSLGVQHARVLYRLLSGRLDDKRRLSGVEHGAFSVLRNAGLVDEAPNTDWTGRQSLAVSEDVAYSLLLPANGDPNQG